MLNNFCRRFFDSDGAEGGNPGGEPGNTSATGAEPSQPQTGKTFTQDDLNRIVVNEKDRAARKVLRDLGFEDMQAALQALEGYRGLEESNTSDIEKATKAREKAEKELSETKGKLEQFEQRIELLSAGVKADKLAEANALIQLKVSDDTTYQQAIDKVKEEFPDLFGISEPNRTGSAGNPPKDPHPKNKGFSGIGKRLAEEKLKQQGIGEKNG